MRLRHLQFGLTLRAAQDFSLLNFVFVHIDFRGTLWAAEHGTILPFELIIRGPNPPHVIQPSGVLYTPVCESTSRLTACFQCNSSFTTKDKPQWRVNIQIVPSLVLVEWSSKMTAFY